MLPPGIVAEFCMAIGPVANLASHLRDQAQNGGFLVTQRLYAKVEGLAQIASIGELSFKGYHKPVPAFQILGMNPE